MSTITLTGETFEETISSSDVLIVDFWAEWCGPCRMFGPVFEDASERHPQITFAKVDTEAEQGLAGALGIMSIPTLMVFREQVLLYNEAGALPGPMLEQLITRVLELDMAEVHAAVEAQRDED